MTGPESPPPPPGPKSGPNVAVLHGPDEPAQPFVRCPHCLKSVAVSSSDGRLEEHGPRKNRCVGSNRLPDHV